MSDSTFRRSSSIEGTSAVCPDFVTSKPGPPSRSGRQRRRGTLNTNVERRLYDIDRADIQAVTGGSDDGFLYARGFVVALGRDFYAAVAEDPKKAVPDAECEKMCYFFAHLHNERYGTFPDTGSKISRESCSNPAGWTG